MPVPSAERGAELRARVAAVLDRASGRASADALAPAMRAFAEYRERFSAPMRVAIVGRVSSGKSTLANALLGCRIVATGVEELTYNVNWLRHAAVPDVTVHFKDYRTPEHRSLDELEALTVRSDQFRELLSEIDYLVISDPNPYLKAFDLIDTPGLDSHFSEDSANTMRFLGLDEAKVRAVTVEHAAKADALVLVFARGAASGEAELLRDFQRNDSVSSAASPLTAVGVLTKVEQYWDPDQQPDPMRTGQRLAERLMEEGGASRYLYHLYPVASLVGEAAVTFDAEDLADLTALAAVDPAELEDSLGFGPGFANDEQSGLPVPAARRRVLFDRFSAYGIALACSLVRDGAADERTLRTELAARSGMTDFRRSLVDHFGRRADLIKLQHLTGQVRDIPELFADPLQPGDRACLDAAIAEVTQLEYKEHAFRELAVLRSFYKKELPVSDAEAEELARVFGESGTSAAARLGLPETATSAELRDRAYQRHAYWSARTVEGLAGPLHHAGMVLRRSYENLIDAIETQGVQ